jgi:hypothetical protein
MKAKKVIKPAPKRRATATFENVFEQVSKQVEVLRVDGTISDAYLEFFAKTRVLASVCDHYTEKTRNVFGREIPGCPERCANLEEGCVDCKHNWRA